MIFRRRLLALAFFASAPLTCHADVYGYVDEEGRGHFSDVRVDSRYQLFSKTPLPAPILTAAATHVVAPAADPERAPSLASPTLLKPISSQVQKRYAGLIDKVAREQELEPALLHAVIAVESAYNARARSPRGATGLMQLMPNTAKRYGVTDLLNPAENLKAGARYLKYLLSMFDNNLRLVLAAYNAGEGAVIRSGRAIPPYRETREYVPRVLQHYEHYRLQARPL